MRVCGRTVAFEMAWAILSSRSPLRKGERCWRRHGCAIHTKPSRRPQNNSLCNPPFGGRGVGAGVRCAIQLRRLHIAPTQYAPEGRGAGRGRRHSLGPFLNIALRNGHSAVSVSRPGHAASGAHSWPCGARCPGCAPEHAWGVAGAQGARLRASCMASIAPRHWGDTPAIRVVSEKSASRSQRPPRVPPH
jgi:hypothetical protein